MAESGVREIQLSGKQLAFLFMASVVVLVVAFLLGVSVGRGAKASTVPSPPIDASVAPEAPIVAPPGTTASPDSLSYQKTLQGSVAAASKPADANAQSAAAPPPPAPVTDPAADTKSTASSSKPPASTPATQTSQTPKPAASTAATTPATPTATAAKSPAPQAGSWYVQVESFKSKALADALVAKLKGMGFDSGITDVPKPLLHVRVGPYAQRSAAEAAIPQLKKDGYPSPFVSR